MAGLDLLTDWSFEKNHLSLGVERSWCEVVVTGLDLSPGHPTSRRCDLGQVASCLRACLLIRKMPCRHDRLGTGPEPQWLQAQGLFFIHRACPSRVGPRSWANRSSAPWRVLHPLLNAPAQRWPTPLPVVFHWAEPVPCPRATSRGLGSGGPEAVWWLSPPSAP